MVEHLPLNALRAFEVAARTGSFVAAGEELGVSSAAVSQQVKALEDTLHRKLFLRQGNRITLTDAGRALYPRLEVAFSELVSVTRDLRRGAQPKRLIVSALPSLAELWLIPALARYDHRHKVDVRIEDDPIDFARSGADLRVTYGAHFYPDHHVETLFRDRFVAVAAKGFFSESSIRAENLKDEDLIHTDWGPNYIKQPDWGDWFTAASVPRSPRGGTGLRLNTTLGSLTAARHGAGIALIPERLAQIDIEQGSIFQIGATGVPMFSDYFIIHPHASSRKRLLRDLCNFLIPPERVAGY